MTAKLYIALRSLIRAKKSIFVFNWEIPWENEDQLPSDTLSKLVTRNLPPPPKKNDLVEMFFQVFPITSCPCIGTVKLP